MLTLNDGRSELWQWDTGRTLAVDADCSQVHFSNKVFGRSIDVDVVDGVAIIPDILLQTDKELTAWAFVGTAENGYTKISKVFKVNRRNKPADYVFTPPEQTTLGEILERLDDLEAIQDPDAIKNAVDDYLEKNPVEAPVQSVNGKTGKVELTADDVGAISQDDLQEATDKALAQAKASGQFDGADGKPGADGKDGVIALTGAKVGQIAKITAVDENGVPTAWEPVDLPSGGGGGGWTVLDEVTLTEDAVVHLKLGETLPNFSKVRITAIIPALSESKTIRFSFTDIDTSSQAGWGHNYGVGTYTGTGNTAHIIEIEPVIVPDKEFLFTRTYTVGGTATVAASWSLYDHSRILIAEYFFTQNSSCPAGTTIKLEGVKA